MDKSLLSRKFIETEFWLFHRSWGKEISRSTCPRTIARSESIRIRSFDFSGLWGARVGEDPRGSPRRVDPSLPRSGNVRSYLTRVEGEISCISALSTNNVHRRWSSASPTTPGVQAIPRLVIACYYAPLLPSWTTVLLWQIASRW